jgi:hypothetical protein
MSPTPVVARAVHLVGKQGNRLEEVATDKSGFAAWHERRDSLAPS